MKPIVYFSKKIDKDEIIRLFDYLNYELKGKVAVKLHSGEPGNQNFLGPDLFGPIIKKINGTIIENRIVMKVRVVLYA